MMAATTASDVAFVAGKAPGSRQVRRLGRHGQGIIDANRKTKICQHWASGACPFGVKCAFAHGAHELRNMAAVEAERTRFNATGANTGQYPSMVTRDPAASYCDSWCSARHDRIMCSTESRLLPGSKDDLYRAPRTTDRGLDGFLLDRLPPSDTMDDMHSPMSRLRLDSQQTRTSRQAVHMGERPRGDTARGNVSRLEFPSTMLQGSASARSEIAGRQYKVDEETPRRVFQRVNSRAESGGMTPREFHAVNIHTTAVTEGGLRDSIRERETTATVARGGYGPPGNGPLCMQRSTYEELGEASCRSGESSRPRPRNDTESVFEFAYFQSRRGSQRVASVLPKWSSPASSAPSASAAPPTTGNAFGWDPITYDAPHVGDPATVLYEDKNNVATGTGRVYPTIQRGLEEDDTSAEMVSVLLELMETRPLPERSVTPWCAPVVPPAEELSSTKRLDTAEVPRSSRSFRDNGTRLSESTRSISKDARESTMATLQNTPQPMRHNHKPPAPFA